MIMKGPSYAGVGHRHDQSMNPKNVFAFRLHFHLIGVQHLQELATGTQDPDQISTVLKQEKQDRLLIKKRTSYENLFFSLERKHAPARV